MNIKPWVNYNIEGFVDNEYQQELIKAELYLITMKYQLKLEQND